MTNRKLAHRKLAQRNQISVFSTSENDDSVVVADQAVVNRLRHARRKKSAFNCGGTLSYAEIASI